MTVKSTLLCLAFFLISGCAATREVEFVSPKVDSDLLTPVAGPSLRAETQEGLGLLLIDYHAALDACNGQLLAIAETLGKFNSAE